MPDTRRKDLNWNTGETPCWDGAQLAVLMDIRDELKQLNRTFACANFLRIPTDLREIRIHLQNIRRHTTKKRQPRQ